MSDQKPCCAAAVIRDVRQLTLPDGCPVGVVKLERIINEVAELELLDSEAVSSQLLKRVKVYNYVAARAEADYADALLSEYRRSTGRET